MHFRNSAEFQTQNEKALNPAKPYTKKFYVHEIAAVDWSKIYFLKKAKKTCKPSNHDLNHDWIKFN